MCPADPQTEYRNHGAAPEELAALIDGEIADMHRIEQLKDLLQGDDSLRADYDAQREIKLLLAQLPEAEAPSFMHTRIMGEISTKKRQRHSVWLPKWGAAAAAVAVFGMGYGAALQFASQQTGTVHMVAQTETAPAEGITAAPPQRLMQNASDFDIQPALVSETTPAVDAFESIYAASTEVKIPEEADPWLREFIELGNEAHNYSRAMRLTHNFAAPDVSQAVMVVDSH